MNSPSVALKQLSLLSLCAAVLFVLGGDTSAFASGPPDATLFTTYTMDNAHTTVNFVVCGSIGFGSGCYDAGNMGPFGKVGAILEGNRSQNLTTNTVTRNIFVLDVASGTNATGVTLYIYKRTDAITSSFDTTTVTLVKTVSLPIMGGISARASMAGNAKFLFIGTNQSPNAIEVKKGTWTFTGIGGFSPPINVSAITSDKYGYVTVTFGSFSGGESGFVVFGPDGGTREDGGGASFTLTTDQAFLPSTLP
jgi:hypothetical protein